MILRDAAIAVQTVFLCEDFNSAQRVIERRNDSNANVVRPSIQITARNGCDVRRFTVRG